ncbi:hypothetical protein ABPG75_000715 [Micractinium tetrahymenae]
MLRRKLQEQRRQNGAEALAHPPQQRQRAPLRRPGPQSATLAVPLSVAPTPAECAALLRTLVKHLLFQRAQIPFLYDELLRASRERQRADAEAAASGGAGAARRRRRAPREDRRLIKFLSKAEEAMASIDAALEAVGVPRRAFLLLGSSTAKPREAYEVVMPPASVGPAWPPPQQAQQAPAADAIEGAEQAAPSNTHPAPCGRQRPSRQERLCQLALRQLVVGMAELPEGTAHTVPCKLFLLLEGSSDSDTGGAAAICTPRQQLPPPSQQHQAAFDVAPAAAPCGYAIKRHFKLSMRKGVHIKLLLGQRAEEAEAAAAAEEEERQQQGMAAEAAAAQAEGGGGSSDMECGSSSEAEEPEPTVHMSQLPDAEPLPSQAAAEAQASAAATEPGAAVAGPSSVWYLCKTVVKGLNSGGRGDGAG